MAGINTSNISIRKINNDFKRTVSLVDTVSWVVNNNTGQTIEKAQAINIEEPMDFNSGIIPSTDPITLVSESDLKAREDFNKDSRSVLSLRHIRDGKVIKIKSRKPITLLKLIKLSSISNTTVDIIDMHGSVIKTIPDINSILFSENTIKYIINNIENDFEGTELDNYSFLTRNQIPILIENNSIELLTEVALNYVLLNFSNIDWTKVITKKRDGTSRMYKFTVGLRFNIDNIKTFPVTYPLVNTNFNNKQILSEPIMFDNYIKTGSIDLLKELNNGNISTIFLYF